MSKGKVMVIDDEKIVGDMSKLSLEQEGYEVATFLNAEPALALLKEEKFDIVVTDLKMKGIDGMEVMRTVKDLYPRYPGDNDNGICEPRLRDRGNQRRRVRLLPQARKDKGAQGLDRPRDGEGGRHRRVSPFRR